MKSRHREITEVLVRFAMLQCEDEGASIHCGGNVAQQQPDLMLPPCPATKNIAFPDWGVAVRQKHRMRQALFLDSFDTWRVVLQAVNTSLISPELLAPLRDAAARLARQVAEEAVPVKDVAQYSHSLRDVELVLQLLGDDARGLGLTEEILQASLNGMQEKVRQLHRHEQSLKVHLPQLVGHLKIDAEECGDQLAEAFLQICGFDTCASGDGSTETGDNDRHAVDTLVNELDLPRARAANVMMGDSAPTVDKTFGELVDTVETMHAAVIGSEYKQLQSMWKEVCVADAPVLIESADGSACCACLECLLCFFRACAAFTADCKVISGMGDHEDGIPGGHGVTRRMLRILQLHEWDTVATENMEPMVLIMPGIPAEKRGPAALWLQGIVQVSNGQRLVWLGFTCQQREVLEPG